MEIYKKLLAVQAELKCSKSQHNSFGNYNYRSCEDILEALKPILNKHKATVLLCDSIEFVNDRHYVRATAIFADIETGETISTKAFAREALSKKGADDSQITGTASSYARKYALNGLFLIDDTKDADSDENKKESDNKAKAGVNMATEEQLEEIIELCNSVNYSPDTIAKTFKVKDIEELSYSAAESVIKQLSKQGAKK